MKPENPNLHEQFKTAWVKEDAGLFKQLLDAHPELKQRINEPVAAFDAPIITQVRSRAMLDVLLDAGADINARSQWWAGGFGLLDSASPELAAYAIERGAILDVHSASRLGLLEPLRVMVSAHPERVNARGGDGQTPLHFASTVPIAEYLLDQGPNIDALDVDHESTPAQYMVRDRQEVLRFLIQRGCRTDLLMAAALGDTALVQKHLSDNPECIRIRVNPHYFPMLNRKAGGTIYQWTLGFNLGAHEVARQLGHQEVFELLMRSSPPDVKLIASCWLEDEGNVRALLKEHPSLASSLIDSYAQQVADAARNNNVAAVRLMLEAGLPVQAVGQHGATPLHWAAFHGNSDMVKAILPHKPPLEILDRDFNSSPLGWAIHGSKEGWYHCTGNYAGTVELLLQAGAKPPLKRAGSDAVQAVLRAHFIPE